MIAGQLYRPEPTVITAEEYERMLNRVIGPLPTDAQVPLLEAAAEKYPRLVRVGNASKTTVVLYPKNTTPPRLPVPVDPYLMGDLTQYRWVVEVASDRYGGCGVTWYRLTEAGERALAEVFR